MKKVLCVLVVLVFVLPALAGAAPFESQVIVNASSSLAQPLRLQIEALREQLKELLAQPSLNATAIGNLMIQIKDLRGQIAAEAKNGVIQFIGLTPTQVTQWEGFVEKRNQIVQPLRLQIKTLNEQIRGLLEQSSPNPTAIGNLRIQVNGFIEQIKTARNAYIVAFKGILTEDQIKKLDIMLKLEQQKIPPNRP
jgi:hypothetical protein